MRPIGGVDVDEDRADLRCRVLDERPLPDVLRPDAHPVALAHAALKQRRGEGIGVPVELGVRPTAIGASVDEGDRLGVFSSRAAEVRRDRLAEQGGVRGAGGVGECGHVGVLLRRGLV
ncbi:Uncharacterised protein [Mycobacteroides abscessus subsp. abscessus]|nr:Uncharacterised protein [Mycobacteroides abscessus subsp. abscessus]